MACGAGPCRPSLTQAERSELATGDRVRRGPSLRTGFRKHEQGSCHSRFYPWRPDRRANEEIPA